MPAILGEPLKNEEEKILSGCEILKVFESKVNSTKRFQVGCQQVVSVACFNICPSQIYAWVSNIYVREGAVLLTTDSFLDMISVFI